ncbi:MAG: FG-GAP-like repeat-containing protein, partial [Phycisphaerae bacterium]
ADTDISLGGGRQTFDTGVVNLPIAQLDPANCLGGAPLPPEAGGAREFSVPGLVGVSLTAPYFHNHALDVLRDSVEFYNSAEFTISPAGLLIGGIELTVQEVDDVTAFLNALIEPTLVDCNTNTIDDFVEIAQGTSLDCNFDSIPDECQLAANDCNANLVPDECDTIPVIMSPAASFSGGGGSFHVAAADFDADGADDLAVPNWSTGQVTIMLSNGAGVFSISAQPAVGSLPRTVATGDVDRDGDVDLVVTNFTDDTLSVLLNNGDPGMDGWDGFALAVTVPLPVSTGPFSVTVADLNGDNEPDLAVANQFSNNVSVVLNNGDPGADGWDGFGTALTYAAGTGPWFVTTGRIDADASLDLLVANWSDATVSVLLNNGSGVFGAPTNLPVGQSPESISAADLNGDGFGDLAVANFQADTISVMMNDGLGGFGPRADIGVGSYPFGAAPHSLVPADLDADGDVDIAVSNNFSNNVTVMVNDGTGNLSQIFNFGSADSPDAVAAGDFDKDGKLDLVTVHFAIDTVAALTNHTPPFGGDCNLNGSPDACDISGGGSSDVNVNTIPDECDPKGDYNSDGAINLTDWAQWPACLTGPGNGPYPTGCVLFDSEDDNDVDLRDYGQMQRIHTIPGQ